MEHIQQRRIRIQSSPLALRIHLPLYLWFIFSILLAMVILIYCAMLLNQLTEPPANPFAAFAAVFPGQPSSAVQGKGFACSANPYGGYLDEYCFVYPATGIFRQVRVMISYGTIRQIAFTTHKDAVMLGDLVALWGRPEVYEYSQSVVLLWPGSGVRALQLSNTGQFSLFSPVGNVMITNTDMSSMQ